MQTTSNKPNEVVDPEMYPGSQPPSRRNAEVALMGFFCCPEQER